MNVSVVDLRHGVKIPRITNIDRFLAEQNSLGDVPLVYVAGPYRAQTEHEVWDHIMEARAVGIEINRLGGFAIVPHLLGLLMGGVLADPLQWLRYDLTLLSKLNAAFFMPSWKDSEGARVERRFCQVSGLPIYDDLAELGTFICAWPSMPFLPPGWEEETD